MKNLHEHVAGVCMAAFPTLLAVAFVLSVADGHEPPAAAGWFAIAAFVVPMWGFFTALIVEAWWKDA